MEQDSIQFQSQPVNQGQGSEQNAFLSRMDQLTGTTPDEPKKSPVVLIVAILVFIAAAVATVLIYLNMQPAKPTPTETPTPTTPPVDEEMLERNEKRKNDLDALSEAVIKYQKSTKDETLPGINKGEWENLIKKYIPGGLKDSADEDGVYKIKEVCKFGDTSCTDYTKLTWEENKYQIYVVYNAECKSNEKENLVVSSTRKRRVMMYTILEGDETFVCTTN
jgi:hypothetical protein